VNYQSSAGLIFSYDQLDIYEGHYWPVISPAIQTKPVQKSVLLLKCIFRVHAAAELSTKPALPGEGWIKLLPFLPESESPNFYPLARKWKV